MRYKVFNKFTMEDITNRYDWVVTPDGKLYVNEWGDFITYPEVIYVLEEHVELFLKSDVSKNH